MIDKIIEGLKGKSEDKLRNTLLNAFDTLEKCSHDEQKVRDAKRVVEAVGNEYSRQQDVMRQEKGNLSSSHESSCPDEGMLLLLGYHVGQNKGVRTSLRRIILDYVVTDKLPPHSDLVYVDKWSEPGTEKRLEKLATVMCKLQQEKRDLKNESYSKAIREWCEDLDWLRETYYIPYGYSFKWPKY